LGGFFPEARQYPVGAGIRISAFDIGLARRTGKRVQPFRFWQNFNFLVILLFFGLQSFGFEGYRLESLIVKDLPPLKVLGCFLVLSSHWWNCTL